MHDFFKWPKIILFTLVWGVNSLASVPDDVQATFSQDVHIVSSLHGGHVVNFSQGLKSKNLDDAAQAIQRIRYAGMGGQSHQLLSLQLTDKKTSAVPEKHRLSAKVNSHGFALPVMDFDVSLVVMEWQNTVQQKSGQSINNKFTSTWLMNPDANGHFSDKRSQTLSIRPLLNSRFLKVGNDLPVRLYFHMGAVSENLFAKSHTTGEVTKLTSDDAGMAAVKLSHAGLWTLMVERLEGGEKYTSFLNFKVDESSDRVVNNKTGAAQ